jgi:sugar phosphate isomerase/epimerase
MRMSLAVSLSSTQFQALALRGGLAALDRVKTLGYDAVEVAVRDPAEIDGEALLRHCRDLRLPVAAVGTGQAFLHDGLSLTSPDAGVRKSAIERLHRHISLAQRLNSCPGASPKGVIVILGLIRGRAEGDVGGAERRLRDGIDACLDAADGIRLAIEPINRYETDWINTVGEALAVVEQVGDPRLGVLPDTFHMNIEEASIEAALRKAAGRIHHVHVADSNRWAPGDGHVDFASIIRTLESIGYEGYLSAEILPRPDEQTAAWRAIAHLRRFLSAPGERRPTSPVEVSEQ